MQTQFKNIGYFIEYIIDSKLIGTKLIDQPDREEIGYYSTQHHTADTEIVFNNKKRIKKGQSYYTRLYPLCGRKN